MTLSRFRCLTRLWRLVFGLPLTINAQISGTTVERWGMFELSLPGPTHGNPFHEVQWSARFTQGGVTVEVPGFYDGDGTYRARFMPEHVGDWSYTTTSHVSELDGKSGRLTVTPPLPGNHGPVRVAHTFHFAYADGRAITLPGNPYLALRLRRVQ